MNTPALRHPKALIVIHWLTALAVVVAYATSEGGPRLQENPPLVHFMAGLAALLLFVPRLLVRLATPALPAEPGTSALAEKAAKAGHGLLYLLIIAIPLSGWYAASRMGVPVSVGGWVLPALASPVQGHPGPVAEFHELGGNVFIWLAGLHALAALWHHFRLKDGTLRRMSLR